MYIKLHLLHLPVIAAAVAGRGDHHPFTDHHQIRLLKTIKS
jgi:hypothetical protein